MNNKDIREVHKILKEEFPKYHVPIVELIEAQTKDPFSVLLATIISARTKDQTTAIATKKLLEKVKDYKDLKKLSVKEIEELIFPVGFYKNKAKYLKELPNVLEEKFNGKLPETVEELCELPGVGRKTANLVAAVGFKKPAICVDVHVWRINNRLGYTKNSKTPLETEMTLRKKLPKDLWITYNTYLVAFGQRLCTPISPHCTICPIKKYCERNGVKKSR